MFVELGAVADHRAFQVFAKQAEALDQGMDRPQHRPRHIVGVHLIAAHHQQRRALRCFMCRAQQAVHTEQTVYRRVMRLAAGTVQQLVDTRAQDKIRASRLAVHQVWRPFSDAAQTVDQQVVLDQRVAGQGAVQRHVDQMHKSMTTDRDHRALPGIQADIANTLQT
ncbi:hypothetical protein D3C73_807690 [compost metagenome]